MRKLLGSPFLWIGVALLVIGTGPLLVTVWYSKLQGDPNPNPVGPGICAMCTFWPSIGLILFGLLDGFVHWRAERQRNAE